MKVKKVYKYATGQPIPEGAIYLNTVTQTKIEHETSERVEWRNCWLVWHYFLVEVDED